VKLIALLLSVVVLTLTLVPCCALENSDAHASYTKQKATAHKCTEEDDDCCKNCSPFYTCGTCPGFTVANAQVLLLVSVTKPVQHNSVYFYNPPAEVPSSIWQPPKLSKSSYYTL
jgi:hypothetical protein